MDAQTNQEDSARRLLVWGLGSAALGALSSGPIALAIMNVTHPQPPWEGAALFARSYHPVQLLPFGFGMLLVSGFVVTIAALHELAPPQVRPKAAVALVFTAAFAALVFLNYVLQTTFVPALALDFDPSNGPLVSAFSMSNPSSLAWGLEMWGYALLGVATWLCAPIFGRDSWAARAAAWCFVVNGPVSIAGGVATVVARSWLLSSPGLVAFGLWNLLVVAMCGFAFTATFSGQSGDRRAPARTDGTCT